MDYTEKFSQENPPTLEQVDDFINSQFWGQLNTHLQKTYNVSPKLAYSRCAMQMGWNVKYQKSSKSLCTLYPMQGYFTALVVVGKKEAPQVEVLPSLDSYTQDVYKTAGSLNGAKWLMLDVKSENILKDVEDLIDIRVKVK